MKHYVANFFVNYFKLNKEAEDLYFDFTIENRSMADHIAAALQFLKCTLSIAFNHHNYSDRHFYFKRFLFWKLVPILYKKKFNKYLRNIFYLNENVEFQTGAVLGKSSWSSERGTHNYRLVHVVV